MPRKPDLPYVAEEKAALDTLGQTLIRNAMNREWMAQVSPAEFAIASFIYDRTIGWQKYIEFVKHRHMTEGVPGYTAGTGLSERASRDAINKLKAAGFLYQLHLPRGGLYMLRLFQLGEDWEYDDSTRLKAKWSDVRLTNEAAEIRLLNYGKTRPETVNNRLIEHF